MKTKKHTYIVLLLAISFLFSGCSSSAKSSAEFGPRESEELLSLLLRSKEEVTAAMKWNENDLSDVHESTINEFKEKIVFENYEYTLTLNYVVFDDAGRAAVSEKTGIKVEYLPQGDFVSALHHFSYGTSIDNKNQALVLLLSLEKQYEEQYGSPIATNTNGVTDVNDLPWDNYYFLWDLTPQEDTTGIYYRLYLHINEDNQIENQYNLEISYRVSFDKDWI